MFNISCICLGMGYTWMGLWGIDYVCGYELSIVAYDYIAFGVLSMYFIHN